MFGFIKNMINEGSVNNVYAPVSGKCLNITECSDQTFRDCLIGDGFMIEPENDIICAPCDGVLSMVFPTKHAFGIKMNDGTELIVHIGIETANLSGEGFAFLSKINKKVRKGEKIMKCDVKQIKQKGFETPVIVIAAGKMGIHKERVGEEVTKNDIIMIV